jgi:hypothetical protein
MTPKEKATILYIECKDIVSKSIFSLTQSDDLNLVAKRFSLFCVKEIDKAIDFDWMQVQNLDRQHEYWEQVKKEIENL